VLQPPLPGPSEEICRVHDQHDDVDTCGPVKPDPREPSRRLALGSLASFAGAALAVVTARMADAQTATTGSTGTQTAGTTTTTVPKRPTTSDTVLLGFAQSLEYAAAELYDQAAPVLKGDISLITTEFRVHHEGYAEQIGALLGRRAPGVANATLIAERTAAFGARAQPAVLRAMYELEISLASSYSVVLGDLKGTDGAALVASIQPIEARQAVVLGQALGLGPEQLMPLLEGQETGATALTPSAYPIV
jgi:hypothetical protein